MDELIDQLLVEGARHPDIQSWWATEGENIVLVMYTRDHLGNRKRKYTIGTNTFAVFIDQGSPRMFRATTEKYEPLTDMDHSDVHAARQWIRNNYESVFESHRNVQGIFMGKRRGQVVLQFAVVGKGLVPWGEQDLKSLDLPAGLGVAVVEGRFRRLSNENHVYNPARRGTASFRHDPLTPGIGIGTNIASGTLGTFVVRNNSSELCVLTNYHVVGGMTNYDLYQPSLQAIEMHREYIQKVSPKLLIKATNAEQHNDIQKRTDKLKEELDRCEKSKTCIGHMSSATSVYDPGQGVDAACIPLTKDRKVALDWPDHAATPGDPYHPLSHLTQNISFPDTYDTNAPQGGTKLYHVGMRDDTLDAFTPFCAVFADASFVRDHDVLSPLCAANIMFELANLATATVRFNSVRDATPDLNTWNKLIKARPCDTHKQSVETCWQQGHGQDRRNKKPVVFRNQWLGYQNELGNAEDKLSGNSGSLVWYKKDNGEDGPGTVAMGLLMGTLGLFLVINPLENVLTRLDCRLAKREDIEEWNASI